MKLHKEQDNKYLHCGSTNFRFINKLFILNDQMPLFLFEEYINLACTLNMATQKKPYEVLACPFY